MLKYRLIYFDHRGAAEPARLLLNYVGAPFEDVRVKMEDWPAMKPSMLPIPKQALCRNVHLEMFYGVLPVLEVNGKQLGQSFAIYRYLAGKYGKWASQTGASRQLRMLGLICGDS